MKTFRFADAAGRLDRFIDDVKARQFEETGTEPRPPEAVQRITGGHPDDVWQKCFGARSLRPRGRGEPPRLPEHVLAPPERPEFAARLPQTAAGPEGRPIGAVVGKPGRKRGVLARLFRGRDR